MGFHLRFVAESILIFRAGDLVDLYFYKVEKSEKLP